MSNTINRLLEIEGIIGAKLIDFMEKNVIEFGLNEDEQIAVNITTLTGALASFMGCVSETHTKLDELRELVIADMDDALNVARKSISRRQNDDS